MQSRCFPVHILQQMCEQQKRLARREESSETMTRLELQQIFKINLEAYETAERFIKACLLVSFDSDLCVYDWNIHHSLRVPHW